MVKNFALMLIAFIGTTALSPIAFTANMIRKIYEGDELKEYFKTIAIGFDQAGGSIIYGKENFTISSYTYFLCLYKGNRYACIFRDVIDFIFGKNHCRESYYNEIKRDGEEYREIKEYL